MSESFNHDNQFGITRLIHLAYTCNGKNVHLTPFRCKASDTEKIMDDLLRAQADNFQKGSFTISKLDGGDIQCNFSSTESYRIGFCIIWPYLDSGNCC